MLFRSAQDSPSPVVSHNVQLLKRGLNVVLFFFLKKGLILSIDPWSTHGSHHPNRFHNTHLRPWMSWANFGIQKSKLMEKGAVKSFSGKCCTQIPSLPRSKESYFCPKPHAWVMGKFWTFLLKLSYESQIFLGWELPYQLRQAFCPCLPKFSLFYNKERAF